MGGFLDLMFVWVWVVGVAWWVVFGFDVCLGLDGWVWWLGWVTCWFGVGGGFG